MLVAFALALPTHVAAQFNTRLAAETERAFDVYREAAEAQLDWHARVTSGRKPGDITILPINKGAIEVKDGLVHDWVAATLAPNTTPEKVVALLQNYNGYQTIYRPDVTDAKVLDRDGDSWHVSLHLVRKAVLTARFNGEFKVEYHPLGDGRWSVISRSTRLAELDGDRELAPGSGQGFLWRLNAYWLIEPRPDGVYLECRSLSLSRSIPAGLGWLVKPFVTSVPKDSLRDTMQATLRALG